MESHKMYMRKRSIVHVVRIVMYLVNVYRITRIPLRKFNGKLFCQNEEPIKFDIRQKMCEFRAITSGVCAKKLSSET